MSAQVVLITGCSSGFGLCTAARLAASGHRVYGTMRHLDKQDKLLQETKRRGCSLRILQLDVTDDGSIRRALDEITAVEGHLDVLVNNAGYALGGALEEVSELELRGQMETNFFGAVKLIQQSLLLLRKSSSGKILNLSSLAGLYGVPGIGAYSASKFALEGYSEALWHELKLFNISVSLIEPGYYLTDVQINRQLAANSDSPDSYYRDYTRRMLDAAERRAERLNGDPEEVAALIERVVDTVKPRLRYAVGRDAVVMSFLRRILPFSRLAQILSGGMMR